MAHTFGGRLGWLANSRRGEAFDAAVKLYETRALGQPFVAPHAFADHFATSQGENAFRQAAWAEVARRLAPNIVPWPLKRPLRRPI